MTLRLTDAQRNRRRDEILAKIIVRDSDLLDRPPLGPTPTAPAGRYARSVSPQRRARVLLVAGSALVLVSGAVFLLVPQSFGWFAYAPLTETAFTPGFGFLDPTHRWAAVVGLASLVVASWSAGYLAGRRAEYRQLLLALPRHHRVRAPRAGVL